MAETYTSNLGLTKPDYDSPADISVINSNMDKIDNAVANAGKVKSVNDKTGDVTLTAADVGALPSDGTAANATQLNGKDAAYYLGARNLLDNSNFKERDFIKQAGLNGAHGAIWYIGDRWFNQGGFDGVSISSHGLTLSTNAQFDAMGQKVPVEIGKYYTVALKGEGDDLLALVSNSEGATLGSAVFVNGLAVFTFLAEENIANVFFYIGFKEGGGTATLEWAALYEGAYTVDNLPPYAPKGYAVELAECTRRNYQIRGNPYGAIGFAFIKNSTTALVPVSIPEMADMSFTRPTLNYGGAFMLAFDGGSADVESMSIDAWATTTGSAILIVTFAPTSAINAGDVSVLQFSNDADAYIEFSNDL